MNQASEIQELSVLEHNLQGLLMQRQSIELELSEVTTALEELRAADGDVYRVVSSVMMRADKPKLTEELEQKKKLLEMRNSTVEKQQKLFESKAEEIRRQLEESNTVNTKE